MNNITIKKHQDKETFLNLKDEWDHLLNNSPVKSVFLTWEWLFSWWITYGKEKDLWLLTAWRDNQLVGIAPLMRETRKKYGFSLSMLVNIGAPQSDVGGFLFNKEDSDIPASFMEFLAKDRREWAIIELNEIKSNGFEYISSKHLSAEGNLHWLEEDSTHFFINLEDNWEKFSERLSRKFMHNLRRGLKLATEIGEVELKHLTKSELTWENFQLIIEINRYANYPRLYNSQLEQELIREIINQTSNEKSWLDIYILSVKGQAIAYEYGFVYEGRFEDWRSGFDTRFPSNVSIGKVLAMQVVKKCIEERYSEIDFLRGDEAYKREWMPSQASFSNVRIFNTQKLSATLAYSWLQRVKPTLLRLIKRKDI